MKSFYEFIDRKQVTIPDGMEDAFLQFYFLLKMDLMQNINETIFGDIVEFAKMTKQIRDIKSKE